MNLPTMLFILILLVSLWWLLRLRRASTTDAANAKSRVLSTAGNNSFHAVSIKIGKRGCDAAKNMVGRRFLATAAPKLPLPGCTVLDCACRFAHHDDRRANHDRRSPFAPGGLGSGTGSFQSDQRDGRDRRKNDN